MAIKGLVKPQKMHSYFSSCQRHCPKFATKLMPRRESGKSWVGTSAHAVSTTKGLVTGSVGWFQNTLCTLAPACILLHFFFSRLQSDETLSDSFLFPQTW